MDLVAPVYKIELKMFVPTILKTWDDFRNNPNDSDGCDGASVFFREEVVQRFVRRVRRKIHPAVDTSDEHRQHMGRLIRTFSSIMRIRRTFGNTDGLLSFSFEMYAPLRRAGVGDPRDWVMNQFVAPLCHMVSVLEAEEPKDDYEEWRQKVYKEMYRELSDLQRNYGFAKLNVGMK